MFPNDVTRSLELTNVDIIRNKKVMDFIFSLKYHSPYDLLMTFREMLNLYRLLLRTNHLDGDIAEVGVFQGGSACILAHGKGNRHLNLFDTFEGLPDVHDEKDVLNKGEMHQTSEEIVKNRLKDYNGWSVYKGIFPGTSGPVKDKSFSLVHLDTDLYTGTLESLEFFYQRMQKGGIIITHDYSDVLTPGVKSAFDEFFTDKPECVVELWDTHAMIVKL